LKSEREGRCSGWLKGRIDRPLKAITTMSKIDQDQKLMDREKLERLLREGLKSGKPKVIKDLDAYFDAKKRELLKRVKVNSK
jgi:hypothetical protein